MNQYSIFNNIDVDTKLNILSNIKNINILYATCNINKQNRNICSDPFFWQVYFENQGLPLYKKIFDPEQGLDEYKKVKQNMIKTNDIMEYLYVNYFESWYFNLNLNKFDITLLLGINLNIDKSISDFISKSQYINSNTFTLSFSSENDDIWYMSIEHSGLDMDREVNDNEEVNYDEEEVESLRFTISRKEVKQYIYNCLYYQLPNYVM